MKIFNWGGQGPKNGRLKMEPLLYRPKLGSRKTFHDSGDSVLGADLKYLKETGHSLIVCFKPEDLPKPLRKEVKIFRPNTYKEKQVINLLGPKINAGQCLKIIQDGSINQGLGLASVLQMISDLQGLKGLPRQIDFTSLLMGTKELEESMLEIGIEKKFNDMEKIGRESALESMLKFRSDPASSIRDGLEAAVLYSIYPSDNGYEFGFLLYCLADEYSCPHILDALKYLKAEDCIYVEENFIMLSARIKTALKGIDAKVTALMPEEGWNFSPDQLKLLTKFQEHVQKKLNKTVFGRQLRKWIRIIIGDQTRAAQNPADPSP